MEIAFSQNFICSVLQGQRILTLKIAIDYVDVKKRVDIEFSPDTFPAVTNAVTEECYFSKL